MALNLKNARALAAVEEVSRLTGEGKSEAVATALEERLARLLAEQSVDAGPAGRLARVRAIVADSAPRFAAAGAGPDADGRWPDLAADLYDETGLPA